MVLSAQWRHRHVTATPTAQETIQPVCSPAGAQLHPIQHYWQVCILSTLMSNYWQTGAALSVWRCSDTNDTYLTSFERLVICQQRTDKKQFYSAFSIRVWSRLLRQLTHNSTPEPISVIDVIVADPINCKKKETPLGESTNRGNLLKATISRKYFISVCYRFIFVDVYCANSKL